MRRALERHSNLNDPGVARHIGCSQQQFERRWIQRRNTARANSGNAGKIDGPRPRTPVTGVTKQWGARAGPQCGVNSNDPTFGQFNIVAIRSKRRKDALRSGACDAPSWGMLCCAWLVASCSHACPMPSRHMLPSLRVAVQRFAIE